MTTTQNAATMTTELERRFEQAVLNDAHADALLDNQPCDLCGQIEMHPNHRGIGHTHTPAEDQDDSPVWATDPTILAIAAEYRTEFQRLADTARDAMLDHAERHQVGYVGAHPFAFGYLASGATRCHQTAEQIAADAIGLQQGLAKLRDL
jgi:hypothetical protein